MPSGNPSPPPAGSSSSSPEGNEEARASSAPYQTERPYQEILNSPRLEQPPRDTLSPFNPYSADGSNLSSRASSIGGGATPSTFSDSAQSESSLGGLNHVNDGVGQSTVERRMSRVYSTADEPTHDYTSPPAENRRPPAISDAQGGQAPLHHSRSLSSSSLTAADEVLVGKKESCWKTWLRRKVPSYGWLISPGYNLADLPDDLIAGISKLSCLTNSNTMLLLFARAS